jgi:hypothetical protein
LTPGILGASSPTKLEKNYFFKGWGKFFLDIRLCSG